MSPGHPILEFLLRCRNAFEPYYFDLPECIVRKSKIGFLNPKESKNRFCISLLNRSIQDVSDHGASKEPKDPLWARILQFTVCLIHCDHILD